MDGPTRWVTHRDGCCFSSQISLGILSSFLEAFLQSFVVWLIRSLHRSRLKITWMFSEEVARFEWAQMMPGECKGQRQCVACELQNLEMIGAAVQRVHGDVTGELHCLFYALERKLLTPKMIFHTVCGPDGQRDAQSAVNEKKSVVG